MRKLLLLSASIIGICSGCSRDGVVLPEVGPSVRAATPTALGGTASPAHGASIQGSLHLTDLDPNDVRSRFFTDGPTAVFKILAGIDARVDDLNSQSGVHDCLSQPPVSYALAPFGESSVTFWAQCYQVIGTSTKDAPSFIQFGQNAGVTYLYLAGGAGRTAAILTPVGNTYSAHVWMGVGYGNATSCGSADGYDDCSYGVLEVAADASQKSFEMTLAGVGFGYCGAQLKSDGASIYTIGSVDTGESCQAADTFCMDAADLTSPGSCAALHSFGLPALGRTQSVIVTRSGPMASAASGATWGASQYPGGASDTVLLDGTETDALWFGPVEPTSGVGEF